MLAAIVLLVILFVAMPFLFWGFVTNLLLIITSRWFWSFLFQAIAIMLLGAFFITLFVFSFSGG
jgi:hypothetical protein